MPFAGVFCRGEAGAIFKAIARGKSVGSSRRSFLERLGIMAQADIPHEITIFSSPANSPLTVKRKGSSNSLINTDEMRAKVPNKINDGE